MSAFPTYDKKIMEAIRQLTLEEMLMALHDLALALHQDRLRDIAVSESVYGNDKYPIRPAVHGWAAIEHAMLSAGYSMDGFRQFEDLVELFGDEDVAQAVWEGQEELLGDVEAIGTMMEEEDMSMEQATLLRRLDLSPEEFSDRVDREVAKASGEHPSSRKVSIADLLHDDTPDDLSGFGWGIEDHDE